jgi:hypothetical protein
VILFIRTAEKNFEKKIKKIWCNYFSPYLCTPNDEKGNDSVAQLVEQYTFNVWALGSSPSGITENDEGFK